MGSARKRRRLVGFRKRVDLDEEMTRFTQLVLIVIFAEVVVFVVVEAMNGYLIRPLG